MRDSYIDMHPEAADALRPRYFAEELGHLGVHPATVLDMIFA